MSITFYEPSNNSIEIWSLVASILLGLSAIWAAFSANRLNKETVKNGNRIAMRQAIFEIYCFFVNDIQAEHYFDCSLEAINSGTVKVDIQRIDSLIRQVSFIFNDTSRKKLTDKLEVIRFFRETNSFSGELNCAISEEYMTCIHDNSGNFDYDRYRVLSYAMKDIEEIFRPYKLKL